MSFSTKLLIVKILLAADAALIALLIAFWAAMGGP
jgi:hypothetical protein